MNITPLSLDDIHDKYIRRAVRKAKEEAMRPGSKWVRTDQPDWVITLAKQSGFFHGRVRAITSDGDRARLTPGVFLRDWWPVDPDGMTLIREALQKPTRAALLAPAALEAPF